MATKQQIQQVKQNAEDSFLDENFGQLDTRGFSIGLDKLAVQYMGDAFAPDEKFAPLDETGRGHGFLKKAISEAAENDVEMQKILREHGVEDEQKPRSFNTPGYTGEMWFDRGAWHFRVESDDGEKKQFTISVADRETAAMQAARYLNKNRVSIRALSKDEELYVVRLAQMGKLEDAVNNYIAYSVPDYGRNGGIITADPRYQNVCAACAWFVFKHSTPQFQDGPEVREFMTQYVGDRPTNVEILRFAFAAWNEQQKKEERGLLLSQIDNEPPATVKAQDLNDLPDEEIDSLFHDVTRDSLRSKIRR